MRGRIMAAAAPGDKGRGAGPGGTPPGTPSHAGLHYRAAFATVRSTTTGTGRQTLWHTGE